MKTKNLLFYVSLVLAFMFTLSSCKKSEELVPEPTVTLKAGETTINTLKFHVTTTNAEAGAYVCVKEGTTVPGGSEILKEGTAFETGKSVEVEVTGLEASTKYVVVAAVSNEAGRIAVSEEVEMTTAAPARYDIHAQNVDGITITTDYDENGAEAGTKVTVTVSLTDIKKKVTDVTCLPNEEGSGNGAVECTFVEEKVSGDATEYTYTFTMPAWDVKLSAVTNANSRKVNSIVENATLTFIDFPEASETVECLPTDEVRFSYTVNLGYGLETPSVYRTASKDAIEVSFDGAAAVPCWKFTMPDEEVTVEVKAVEKTDYEGKSFLGQYYGYQLYGGENNVVKSSTLKLNLKANTSYTVKSTDNAFDFTGTYVYNETDDTFRYSDEGASYGIDGRRLKEGDLLFSVKNLAVSGNGEPYYGSLTDYENFVSASMTSGEKSLIEISNNGSKQYWLHIRATGELKAVEANFRSGTSIGDADAIAFISIDGTVTYRYVRSAGEAPVFETGSEEKGTYTGDDGDMVLDGFGNITLGGTQSTYTYDKETSKITSSVSGEECVYVLDLTEMTYVKEVKEDPDTPAVWDGPKSYSVTIATSDGKGSINGKNSKVEITIDLDKNGAGFVEKGAVYVYLHLSNFQETQTIIDGGGATYTYDQVVGTITLNQVYGGIISPDDVYNEEKSYVDIVLKVSEDKQSLTITAPDRIYHRRSATKYADVKDVVLSAE